MQRIILSVTFVLLASFAALTVSYTRFQATVEQAMKNNQCVDIPATPNYLATGSAADGIAAINHARIFEHLPSLHLPANFYTLSTVQQQFVLVNLERTDRGLPALRLDAHLSSIAQAYSKQLAQLHFFSHTSPISGSLEDRVSGDPVLVGHYSLAAENLAGNPIGGVGPIYEYLYNDKAEGCGHRLNILNPALNIVGIGVVNDITYGTMSAQEFIASAAWSPYVSSDTVYAPPRISVNVRGNGQQATLNFSTQVSSSTPVERLSWFLDHVSGQPVHVGTTYSLDTRSIAPGRHVVYIFVVDGEQQYVQAEYTFSK